MTRARLRRAALVAAALLFMKLFWMTAALSAGRADLEPRARHVAGRLLAGDDGLVPGDGRFAGEWRIIARSLTALALARLAADDPSRRGEHAALVRGLADQALSPEARAFDTDAWGDDAWSAADGDEGHAGWLGHAGLILSAERLLGSDTHADAERRVARAVERRLDRGGLVVTYPGETYVPDNVVLGAALALHAAASGDDERARLERFVAELRRHLDPDTGVLVFAPGQPGRGSGAAWCSLFLPMIDPAFAREQAEALARAHVARALGLAAVRERPDGSGTGDVDSGPLLFGLSPSATGFAIAGARCSGDERLARALERTAEAGGFTAPARRGRAYLVGPLVGDAAVLAARAGPPLGC